MPKYAVMGAVRPATVRVAHTAEPEPTPSATFTPALRPRPIEVPIIASMFGPILTKTTQDISPSLTQHRFANAAASFRRRSGFHKPEHSKPSRSAVSKRLFAAIVLGVLLHEKSVARTADRLNLTSSAVSHALKRLRLHFDNELLVRDGRPMVPTARGQSLSETLPLLLTQVEHTLAAPEPFEPSSFKRSFAMAAPILAQTEMLLSVLSVAMKDAAREYELETRDLPFNLDPLELTLFTSTTASDQPEMCWFQERVASTAKILMPNE